MFITTDNANGYLVFRPESDEEAQTLLQVIAIAKQGDKLEYDGLDGSDEGDLALIFYVGSEAKMGIVGRVHRLVYEGGVKIILKSSDPESEHLVRQIRYLCFGVTSGLNFFEGEITNDGPIIKVFGDYCKYCNRRIIFDCGPSGSTCDGCIGKCTHEYVELDDDLGGDYCRQCFRSRTFIESLVP